MKEFSACAKTILFKGWGLLVLCLPLAATAKEAVLVAQDPIASIGRVALTLGGMIALILLLAYWAKRLQGMNAARQGAGFSAPGQAIKTLATVSLGLKEKLALIQVGEQQLLIGITPQSIQTLLVLDEPISQAEAEQQTPVFQALLKKALHKA